MKKRKQGDKLRKRDVKKEGWKERKEEMNRYKGNKVRKKEGVKTGR